LKNEETGCLMFKVITLLFFRFGKSAKNNCTIEKGINKYSLVKT